MQPTSAAPCCPNPDCAPRASGAAPRVIRHSLLRTRTGTRQRWRCKNCDRTFVARSQTPYHRLRSPAARFDGAVQMSLEGATKAGIARVHKVAASTVGRWLTRAAAHAQRFQDGLVRDVTAVEVQADEVRGNGPAREDRHYVFAAVEVSSRLWISHRVGSRTRRNCLLLLRQARWRSAQGTPRTLIMTDPFHFYRYAVSKAWGPTCVHVESSKIIRGGRIVRVRNTLVHGTVDQLKAARERCEDSKKLNTAYIERLNLFVRRALAFLHQAIARVNRVFKDKPGGLVVDYLGLAHELKAALATYTESGGTGRTALDQDEAVAVMLEKYEISCGLFHGFDRAKWTVGTPPERLGLLPPAQEHILAQENGKERCLRAVRELSQAFTLAVPHEEALRIRDDVAFFQAVQAVLAKRAPGDARPEEDLDHAVRQIISRAVAPEGVVDIFSAAGLEKPDISILSDEFLAEVRGMPQRNLAVELLQKLLKGELATRRRKNVVQARSFAEMLEQTIRRYQNRAVEAAQVIEELIALAKEMREANARGDALGLSEDELAFYDALETNDSAVKVLGDDTLRTIARELVETVRRNVTIDWTIRENVRAQLRVLVKRILRKHGYPPDKQEKATQTVLEQAELLSHGWAAA